MSTSMTHPDIEEMQAKGHLGQLPPPKTGTLTLRLDVTIPIGEETEVRSDEDLNHYARQLTRDVASACGWETDLIEYRLEELTGPGENELDEKGV